VVRVALGGGCLPGGGGGWRGEPVTATGVCWWIIRCSQGRRPGDEIRNRNCHGGPLVGVCPSLLMFSSLSTSVADTVRMCV